MRILLSRRAVMLGIIVALGAFALYAALDLSHVISGIGALPHFVSPANYAVEGSSVNALPHVVVPANFIYEGS